MLAASRVADPRLTIPAPPAAVQIATTINAAIYQLKDGLRWRWRRFLGAK